MIGCCQVGLVYCLKNMAITKKIMTPFALMHSEYFCVRGQYYDPERTER